MYIKELFLRTFMISFIVYLCNKDAQNVYTWFTCLTHTAKMASFTGLQHIGNTNTLE